MNEIIRFSLLVGWWGFLGGVLSGALIGLFFHKEGWLGGYASRERRMVRLGHISFFGIGLINLLYGLSVDRLSMEESPAWLGARCLLVAMIGMPTICFLCAWREGFRHMFFIPVLSAGLGIGVILFARS